MNRWYHMIAWALSALILESGCMLDFQQRSRSDRQGWAPLRVGVVMPLAVREATTVVRPCILPFRATIGDAIANTLQTTLASQFQDVRLIETASNGNDFDLLVHISKPTISHEHGFCDVPHTVMAIVGGWVIFSFVFDQWSSAHVKFEATVTDSTNTHTFMKRTYSEYSKDSTVALFPYLPSSAESNGQNALGQAVDKFMEDLDKQRDIAQFIELKQAQKARP